MRAEHNWWLLALIRPCFVADTGRFQARGAGNGNVDPGTNLGSVLIPALPESDYCSGDDRFSSKDLGASSAVA
jgi:hypothetical protein